MSRPKNESMHRMGNVLHTKLLPPRLQSSAIARDELLQRLDHSLDKKLSLIKAPTGFGKTTLVRMWLERGDFPSAWVSLDENDNDPSRFWIYIVSALRTFDSAIGRSTFAALNAPQLPSVQTLLTPLINDLGKLSEPCVLVLEDFHSIRAKEIQKSFSFFVQNLPQSLHLILMTRTMPDLPLPLLRARNELMEIDTNDLRFSFQEAETFLRMSTQIELPPASIDSLYQKTEGWVAGLQLAAISLQNREGEEIQKFVQAFSGSHRYISEYLIREVFESQSEAVQDFLIKTCFLQSLTASLCDAVTETNQAAALLEHLERDNLFLVRLEQAGTQIWYRYNPLFAESIQYLARQRLGDATIRALFERASGWYEYYGLLEDAIETALIAKLYERAISLVEKYLQIHDLRELRTLGRWIERIPRQDILQHPLICFTFAQLLLYSGDRFAPVTAAEIEPFLGAAESIWREQENHAELGRLLSFRGNVAWWGGDFPKAFAYARASLPNVPEYDAIWRGNSLLILGHEALNEGRVLNAQDVILEARALLGAAQNLFGVLAALQLLSEVFYLRGDLEQAEQLNHQIISDAVGDASMLDDQGIASLSLANIAYERNELDQAREFATRSLELGKQRANEMLQVQVTIRLSQIYSAHGNFSDAHGLLKSLEAKIQNPNLLRELQNAEALLSIHENDGSALDWWVKIISVGNQNILPMQKERETFTLARLRTVEGKQNEALEILKPWKLDSAENGRVRSQVEVLILEALAYYADSHLSKAVELLTDALTLAHAKGFRRIFLDAGPRMARLLRGALPWLPNRTLSLFASTLLHSFPAETMPSEGADGSNFQTETLSQQELRVLRLLAADLSNADIAQELVVSNNTIKTHVKSIYRKLNVKSRQEARQVARELKLV